MKLPTFIMPAIAIVYATSASPALAFKAESMSAAEEKRLQNFLLTHRCADGKTVAQILAATRAATNGGFIPRGASLSYNGEGRVIGVSAQYVLNTDTTEGGEISMGWDFAKSRRAVEPAHEAATIMQLGTAPFIFYMNNYLKDAGAKFSAKKLKDFGWLYSLPGVRGVSGVHVTEAQLGAFSDNQQALSLRVWFSRNGYDDLHADWVKADVRARFTPSSPWAVNFEKGKLP